MTDERPATSFRRNWQIVGPLPQARRGIAHRRVGYQGG